MLSEADCKLIRIFASEYNQKPTLSPRLIAHAWLGPDGGSRLLTG